MEFRFASPWLLLLLVPALIWATGWLRGRWRKAPAVLRYSDTRLLSNVPAGTRARLRRIPDVLRLFAWVLLVAAIARPQTGSAQQVIRGQGVDLVIALDLSQSMNNQDFGELTRLEAVRQVTRDFIVGRPLDRIGLVVFQEEAFYRAPPTHDHDLLLELLEENPFAHRSSPGRTAIGVGLASAANMLRDSEARSRVIVLVTDGSNNTGTVDPSTAARAAAALGMRVYVVGIGLPHPYLADTLDEELLRQIAQITDGQYFHALQLSDLEQFYTRIGALEKTDFEQLVRFQWQDQAQPLLLAALGCLFIERILRRTLFQTIP